MTNIPIAANSTIRLDPAERARVPGSVPGSHESDSGANRRVKTVMSSFWPWASAARAMESADWLLMAAVRSNPGSFGDRSFGDGEVSGTGEVALWKHEHPLTDFWGTVLLAASPSTLLVDKYISIAPRTCGVLCRPDHVASLWYGRPGITVRGERVIHPNLTRTTTRRNG